MGFWSKMTLLLISLAALAAGTVPSASSSRPSASALPPSLGGSLAAGGESDILRQAFGRLRFDLGGGVTLYPRCLRFTPTDADGQERPLELRLDWRLNGARATIRLRM